jgi:hypothetical protein
MAMWGCGRNVCIFKNRQPVQQFAGLFEGGELTPGNQQLEKQKYVTFVFG